MGLITMASNLFIRPVRTPYQIDALGPNTFEFGTKPCERHDYEIVNSFGLKLQGTLYKPSKRAEPGPCMIYLHGSGANRLDSLDCLELLLGYDIALFCLDLTGAGLSEGKYISLGYHEKKDVKAVIGFLRGNGIASKIGLWGRSMGAATALLFREVQEEGEDITTLILDSPFSSLKLLSREIVANAKINNVPRGVTQAFSKLGLKFVRKGIRKRAKFDIFRVEPSRVAPKCTVPVIFIHAEADTLIHPHHSEDLFEKYGGTQKKLLKVQGTHSSLRTASCFDEISAFIHEHFLDDAARELYPKPLRVVPHMDEHAHYFLCKELPVEGTAQFISRFQANVVFSISQAGVKLYRPFTNTLIEEYHFDEIIGFWLDSPEVFLFSLKADIIKMKLLEDGTFGEAATEGGICACYSVESMAIMKVVQITTRDLFVSKLLDESLRSAVLQAVVVQTAKQACRSTGSKPDATSITRDITQYIHDLLLERNISEEEVEKVLHPIPFFVSSSLGRVIKEEEEARRALNDSDPSSRSDEKKERRKSDRQSRRKSTLSSSSSLARTRASTSALPPTSSSSSGTSPSLKSDSKPKRTRSQTHTAASLSSPSSTPQAQRQQQQNGASEKALKKSSSKQQQRARSATSQSLIRKEVEDDVSPMENGQSA